MVLSASSPLLSLVPLVSLGMDDVVLLLGELPVIRRLLLPSDGDVIVLEGGGVALYEVDADAGV